MITGLEDEEAELLYGLLTDAAERARGGSDEYLADYTAQKIERVRDKLGLRRECPYSFAHTRHWCGYPQCRDH